MFSSSNFRLKIITVNFVQIFTRRLTGWCETQKISAEAARPGPGPATSSAVYSPLLRSMLLGSTKARDHIASNHMPSTLNFRTKGSISQGRRHESSQDRRETSQPCSLLFIEARAPEQLARRGGCKSRCHHPR